MKALVTGANGLVGANLIRSLLDQGHRARAFVRSTSDLRSLNGVEVELAFGDILEVNTLIEAADEVWQSIASNGGSGIDREDFERSFLARIEAAGGRRVMPRTVGPDFGATHILVFTSFLDPAGNEIGLVERPRD